MSASSAGGMARMRCLPQRSDGLVVKACAVSTKRQLHRFGIVRLQRLCSTCAESRLQQTRWGEARTLCSCNSIMRNQQMSSPSARFPAVRLAREQCGSKGGTACNGKDLAKVWTPAPRMLRPASEAYEGGVCGVLCFLPNVRVHKRQQNSLFWASKSPRDRAARATGLEW